MKKLFSLISCGALFISFIACNQANSTNNGEGKKEEETTVDKRDNTADIFKQEVISTKISNPWGITWLDKDKALITEKKGIVYILEKDEVTDSISGLPKAYTSNQAGYFDIAIHPKHEENGWIYMTYAKPQGDGGSTTLIRFKLDGNKAIDLEELYQTLPVTNAGVHFGSRIIFDNAGYLFFSTGERGVKENAQDLTNDMGKIHRLKDDGEIPSDNPFYDEAGAKKSIWTYGNRNVQGMVYDSVNDKIYATEHGPKGGDELNLIEKGANYGWPVITYGIDYDGSIISDLTEKEGMEQPLHYWDPSIATCGLMLYTGDKFPEWKNDIFSGALAKTHVARISLDKNDKLENEEKLLEGIGRVRQVAQSPDGYVYVLTEGPGQVVKLSPSE